MCAMYLPEFRFAECKLCSLRQFVTIDEKCILSNLSQGLLLNYI
jgi:hypothetical protein